LLADAGANSATIDWFLQRIFFVGKIRRAFSLSRFCATYDMQLEAGVNVIDSLTAAGKASRSGRISRAVDATLPEVRQGEQVGAHLAASGAFPLSFTQTFLVAEETGDLDKALARLSTEYQAEAMTRLNTASVWLPQILYFSLLMYFGWTVIHFYMGYFDSIERQVGSL
jgi:type II secretory pathway component PulF